MMSMVRMDISVVMAQTKRFCRNAETSVGSREGEKICIAEQKKCRKAESRIRRAQEVRVFLEDLFHNLGMWMPDSTQKEEEIVSSTCVPDLELNDLK